VVAVSAASVVKAVAAKVAVVKVVVSPASAVKAVARVVKKAPAVVVSVTRKPYASDVK